MNDMKRFAVVYVIVERLHGRDPTSLEIGRAYKRYLRVTDQQPKN
jgi:hypothetical protein